MFWMTEARWTTAILSGSLVLTKELVMMRKSRRIRAQSGKKSHGSRKLGRRKLGFQSLELRRLMASDIGLSDGFICVTGSDADDAVDVFVDGDQVMVSTAEYSADGELVSSTGQSFPLDSVRGIFFRGGGGADTFVNDTNLRAVAMGGNGDDILVGGSQRDVLHGGHGDDVLLGSRDIMMGGTGDNALVSVDAVSEEPAVIPEAAAELDPTVVDEPSDPVVDEVVSDDIVVDEIISVDIVADETISQDDGCLSEDDEITLVDATDTDAEDTAAPVEEAEVVPVDEGNPPVEDQPVVTSTPHFGITYASSFTMLADNAGSWANAWLQSTATATIGSGARSEVGRPSTTTCTALS